MENLIIGLIVAAIVVATIYVFLGKNKTSKKNDGGIGIERPPSKDHDQHEIKNQ